MKFSLAAIKAVASSWLRKRGSCPPPEILSCQKIVANLLIVEKCTSKNAQFGAENPHVENV